jgi:phage gp37-like protein
MRLSEVEQALVAKVKEKLGYLSTVESISGRGVDEDGMIIAIPPAVLVMLAGETLGTRDVYAKTYEQRQRFLLIAGAVNLRSPSEEKLAESESNPGVYKILDDMKDALAGARLLLPSGAQQPMVVLGPTELYQFSKEGAWYSLEVTVQGVYQAPV